MRVRYITPFVVLVACLVTCIINIINGVETLFFLKSLLLILITSNVIGAIGTAIVTKVTTEKKEEVSTDIDVDEEKEEDEQDVSANEKEK